MKKQYIGISPRYILANENTATYLKIYDAYTKQIIDRNFIPLVLFDGPCFDELIKMCDGFLILGGDDINPTVYGENNDLNLSKDIDDNQDITDKKILDYAVKHKVPTFGICRGIQSIAAMLGGTLHQDISYANLYHPASEKKHMVTKVANGPVSSLLPDIFETNTFHHQCVNKVPEDFIVTYVNGDVIEAIEHKTLPMFAVQWHPERYYTKESEIMFDYFKQKVIEYGKNN